MPTFLIKLLSPQVPKNFAANPECGEPTGNLDQGWGHGNWVDKAPMTDDIILTENRDRCTACHLTDHRASYRVPRISTGGTVGASVFIIQACCGDADITLSERADGFTDGVGTKERRERKGARPSETPTSEISGRPVVKARSASPPMIVPTAEGSGAVVLSTPTLSSKDEMTMWQFEATAGINCGCGLRGSQRDGSH